MSLTNNSTLSCPTSEGHHSLFGSLTNMDVQQGSLTIIAIIAAVVFLEYYIRVLHESTVDSAFAEMLGVLEKELMIIGTMSFVFKTVQSSIMIDPQWFLCLEFADTFIPITVFFFCIQGGTFIIMSSAQCSLWSKGYRHHRAQILTEFYENYSVLMDRFRWLRIFWWSDTLSRVEFRIVHLLFCEEFHIERHAFEFDEYVIRVFEKFIINIIEVRPENWIVVIVIVFLNWIRVEVGIFSANSDDCDDECRVLTQVKVFTVLGALIFVLNFILLCFSRIYEHRYFAHHNIFAIREYAEFLENEENLITKKDDPNHHKKEHKITQEDLKNLAKSAKSTLKHNTKKRRSVISAGYLFVKKHADHARAHGLRRSFLLAGKDMKTSMADVLNLKSLEKIRDHFNETVASRHTTHVPFRTIFLFGMPALYFATVEHVLMIISLYCGLWVTNFQYSILESLSWEDKVKWFVYSALPGLLSMLLFIPIVKSAAFLRAATTLDADCVHQTIEYSEEAQDLGRILKKNMLKAVVSQGHGRPETQLQRLFKEIHSDETNLTLTRFEFQVFVQKMGIDFSDRRWRQILQIIDRNHDDEISFREVMLFLFPTNRTAKREEDNEVIELHRVMQERSKAFHALIGREVEGGDWNAEIVGYNKQAIDQTNKAGISKYGPILSKVRNVFIGSGLSISRKMSYKVHPDSREHHDHPHRNQAPQEHDKHSPQQSPLGEQQTGLKHKFPSSHHEFAHVPIADVELDGSCEDLKTDSPLRPMFPLDESEHNLPINQQNNMNNIKGDIEDGSLHSDVIPGEDEDEEEEEEEGKNSIESDVYVVPFRGSMV